MRKSFLILFPLLLSGCAEMEAVRKTFTPPPFTAKDLIGKKWYCKSSYSMWNMLTEEHYTYYADGTLSNNGLLTVKKDGKEFKYTFTVKGIWQLNGWHIFEKAEMANVKKAYSEDAQQALKAKPKLAEWEKIMYPQIKSMEQQAKQGANREIETLTLNQLTTTAGTSYVICERE